MDFEKLIHSIRQTHETLQSRVASAINRGLVARNWLFGVYIVEFEQNGHDYAQYGDRLLYRLSEELGKGGMKGVSYTNLTLYRKFYLTYPQFAELAARLPLPEMEEKMSMQNLQALPEDLSEWKLAVVRYATGSMDNRLFVSKYMLQLPGEETLRQFLLEEKRHLEEIRQVP